MEAVLECSGGINVGDAMLAWVGVDEVYWISVGRLCENVLRRTVDRVEDAKGKPLLGGGGGHGQWERERNAAGGLFNTETV